MPGWGTDFSLCHNIQICPGAHPILVQWILGFLSLGVEQPRHEFGHIHICRISGFCCEVDET